MLDDANKTLTQIAAIARLPAITSPRDGIQRSASTQREIRVDSIVA